MSIGTTGGVAPRTVRPALLLAGLFLLAANMRAALTVVSPLMGRIRADLDLSSAATSALISLPLLCFAAVSPLAPKLANRWGIEATLTGSLAVLTVGIVLRSLPSAPVLWAGTVLIGAAIACINVLLPSLLKRDFPTRIGPLTGVYNGIQSGFAAVTAAVAVPVADLPGSGWRLALGCTAAVALIGLGAMLPQLRLNSRGPTTRVDTAASDPSARPRPLLRSATAWQVALFMGFQSSLFYSIVTWWPTLEQDHGIADSVAGWHMALIQTTGIVGSLTTGALLRRLDERLVTMAPVFLVLVGFVGEFLAPSVGLVWAVLIGAGAGGNIVAALALFGARTRDHRRAAALSGMGQSLGYLLAAAVPPVLGAVHDASGGWELPLLILIGLAAAAAVFGGLGARDRPVQ